MTVRAWNHRVKTLQAFTLSFLGIPFACWSPLMLTRNTVDPKKANVIFLITDISYGEMLCIDVLLRVFDTREPANLRGLWI